MTVGSAAGARRGDEAKGRGSAGDPLREGQPGAGRDVAWASDPWAGPRK